MEQKIVSRREFIVTSGKCIAAAGIMIPAITATAEAKKRKKPMEPIELDLITDKYASLGTIDGAVKIPDPEDPKHPIIVTRVSEDAYAAFSSRCTHWGCEVELPEDGIITCKCHKSTFDINGKVTHGPAKKDLRRFETRVDGTRLTISGPAE